MKIRTERKWKGELNIPESTETEPPVPSRETVCALPPIRSLASRIITFEIPLSIHSLAAPIPAAPAPIITTKGSSSLSPSITSLPLFEERQIFLAAFLPESHAPFTIAGKRTSHASPARHRLSETGEPRFPLCMLGSPPTHVCDHEPRLYGSSSHRATLEETTSIYMWI